MVHEVLYEEHRESQAQDGLYGFLTASRADCPREPRERRKSEQDSPPGSPVGDEVFGVPVDHMVAVHAICRKYSFEGATSDSEDGKVREHRASPAGYVEFLETLLAHLGPHLAVAADES